MANDDLIISDELARRNLELTVEALENDEYGGIWLDLDTVAFKMYRDRQTSELPAGYWSYDPAMTLMLTDIADMDVLCLAGGGGQQSAVCSLLGAAVTVLDLTPEQLARDQIAARHYGYEVKTIQGDMRDLSVLRDKSFGRVVQPISTLYVPDLRQVFAGVARVLQPGGLYYADFVYPSLHMPEDVGWDGVGYVLRFTQPHKRGAIFETESDDLLNFTKGVSFGEFNHLLSDIVNGLIAEGLAIKGVWERPRPNDPRAKDLVDLEPGSAEHRDVIIPNGLAVVAEKLR